MTEQAKSEKKAGNLMDIGGGDRIGRAIVLPWSTAIAIAKNSMRQRFWRSIITTSLIVAAIAFMVYTSSQSAILNHIKVIFDEHDAAFKSKTNPTAADKEAYEPWQKLGRTLDDMGIGATDKKDQGAQSWWLMSLAALVAFVGIMNAMLMSVTERFREIGTMKCLGALDSFIIKLFFLESVFQGMTGTIIGIIVGFILVLMFVAVSLGSIAWGLIPFGAVFGWIGISFLVGTAISIVAAILPAWRAAIMQPVDALRSEI